MFFGEPGPWFNKMEMDGDKTTIFHDIDGSVSEYPGAFLVKEDNWLLRHPDCIDIPDWRAAICSGHYAQVSPTHTLLLLPKHSHVWCQQPSFGRPVHKHLHANNSTLFSTFQELCLQNQTTLLSPVHTKNNNYKDISSSSSPLLSLSHKYQ